MSIKLYYLSPLKKILHSVLGALFSVLLLASCSSSSPAVEETQPQPSWPVEFEVVDIPAVADSIDQKAYFRKAHAENQPLAVVLHTWSSDYSQIQHNLASEVLHRDWNYIHPDFQGPNRQPSACCSDIVIEDINAAISYALNHSTADPGAIHVLGASGGGYATLCYFMKGQHEVSSYSAWVPISDLIAWHDESTGRQNRYASEIRACTASGENLDTHRAAARSPLFMQTPTGKLQSSTLNLFAGIHDGYTGSVPITQSLFFYNKMVKDHGLSDAYLISDEAMHYMLRTRLSPESPPGDSLGSQPILFQRATQSMRVGIFDGGHEMVDEAALDQLNWHHHRPQVIVTIGDSNGASETGWVTQLQSLRPDDHILNFSVSGNTIGFDNLDNPNLNTLRHINSYLENAVAQSAGLSIDEILINLGTNDSKAIFDTRSHQVPINLFYLIDKIQQFPFDQIIPPRITIITPPPYGPDSVMLEKYHGGAERVESLVSSFKQITTASGIGFIDIHALLNDDYPSLAPDGIHMTVEGQRRIAMAIHTYLTP